MLQLQSNKNAFTVVV